MFDEPLTSGHVSYAATVANVMLKRSDILLLKHEKVTILWKRSVFQS